jgi:NSS family neurotransmitter:Na+ symporter
MAVFCSLSVGANTDIQVLGLSLMDFCDYLTAQYMMPTGAFLTSIMLGWFVDRKLVQDEFAVGGSVRESFFRVWLFSVRFIVPVCLVLIFLHQFGVI